MHISEIGQTDKQAAILSSLAGELSDDLYHQRIVAAADLLIARDFPFAVYINSNGHSTAWYEATYKQAFRITYHNGTSEIDEFHQFY